ncbi:MAG: response regulator [Bacillus sp. (in: Bacteria)]|nr:response regulator [Bacillus sp. (in: firmicutes)]
MIKTVIVEDDPMVAEINCRYLDHIEGFELVGIAASVESAILILDSEKVDLILLDIHLPGENGWSLLSTIRGVGIAIDVIVITASCDKESIKKGLRLGVVDYLIKPFELERFQEALQSYRKEQMIINDQEKMNQIDLDQFLLHKEQRDSSGYELPKGLTKNTLIKVWDQVSTMGKQSFSTEELACMVGISRVSMRKYVSFLTEIQILETEVVYGTVGRPVYMYHVANLNNDEVMKYIS